MIAIFLSCSNKDSCYIDISEEDSSRIFSSHRGLYSFDFYKGNRGYEIVKAYNTNSLFREGDVIIKVDNCNFSNHNLEKGVIEIENRISIGKFLYVLYFPKWRLSNIHEIYIIRDRQKLKLSGFLFSNKEVINDPYDEDIKRITEFKEYPLLEGTWQSTKENANIRIEKKIMRYYVEITKKNKEVYGFEDVKIKCNISNECFFNSFDEPLFSFKIKTQNEFSLIQFYHRNLIDLSPVLNFIKVGK